MGTSGLIVDRPEITQMADLLKEQGRELRDLARSPASTESADQLQNRIKQVADLTLTRFVELDDLQSRAGELDFTILDHLESIREDYERAISGLTQTSTAQRLLGVAAAQTVGERLMTLGNSVRPFEVGRGQRLTLAEGRAFHSMKFEGVLGAKVARELDMKIGDEFQLEHGGNTEDVHAEVWKVVGILAPTGTSFDDTIYIPLISSWAVPEHEHFMELAAEIAGTPDMDAPISTRQPASRANASPQRDSPPALSGGRVVPNLPAATNEAESRSATASESEASGEAKSADGHDHHDHEHAFTLRPDGTIKLDLEREKWRISGIFVGTPGFYQYGNLRFNIEQKGIAMAVSPAQEMRAFFIKFLEPGTKALSIIAILVSVLAAITILVSIYNSVVARRRDIAILRALGATRNRVLSLITLEAIVIGFVGGMLGLLGGYAMVSIGLALFGDDRLPIRGLNVGWFEWAYLVGVVVLAALAGLVPALAAYRVSVADNLASE
jgi:putative ABC transport system permease protein